MASTYIRFVQDGDIRGLLNKMKWDCSYDLRQVRVWYVNRGSSGNRVCIQGNHITEIRPHFFYTDQGPIPYHRIRRIDYEGRKVFPG